MNLRNIKESVINDDLERTTSNVVAELDERETELVLRYIYQLRNDDLINEDGEVIVDSFYKNLLEDINPNEAAVAYTEEEVSTIS